MRAMLLAATALLGLAGAAQADQRLEARLAGHAVLPAFTMTLPPADAPRDALVSGKFTGAAREERPSSISGTTGPGAEGRPTGISLPFIGQPVQGFSGIKPVQGEPGAYWVLTDNGFGSKKNSPDALLMFHKVRPDFRAGTVAVERTVFLSDPDRQVPFRIAYEGTEARYLTGADFDPESIQPIPDGQGFWIGEEFGPYLIRVDAEGRVRQVVETRLEEKVIRSPDHPALTVAASPTAGVPFQVQRSGGYEGMAMLPDGSRLWALLEKPVLVASGQPEGAFLRMLEFDTARGDWTGHSLKYRLEPGATAIGDFNFIDERRALVIERDNGEGDPSLACAQGQGQGQAQDSACFANPARHKRVYLIDLGAADAEGSVKKLAHIDLMDIRDPEGVARQRGDRAANAPRDRFTFPFFTIEDVAMVNEEHIIVANDNNLPFSAGRYLTRADDNEFILLHVPELLRTR